MNSLSADVQTWKERERGGGRRADIPTVVPTPFFFFRLELLAAPRLVNSQSADMQTGKERERGGGRSADIPTVVPTLFFFLLRIEDQGPGSPVSSMCWAYELEACAVQVIRVHFWESFLAFPLEVRQDIYLATRAKCISVSHMK